MSITKKGTTVFDDNFEVTYEEEIPFTYSFDTKPISGNATDKTVVIDTGDYRPLPKPRREEPARKTTAASYGDDYENDSDNGALYDNATYDDGYEEEYDEDSYRQDRYGSKEDYDYYSESPRRKRAGRSSSAGAQRLISPVRKTAKYGTKAIYHVARRVVRVVSILITAGTLGLLAYNFWRGAAPYGDPQTILTEKNYALAAYAAVAALILMFETVAFFWSLTRMKIREGRKIYREDTGRGLFSFIFIYITSYLSFLLCSFLPETLGSSDILNGIKGGLNVFGSLHNALIGLCLAGVISCLVRRHMN